MNIISASLDITPGTVTSTSLDINSGTALRQCPQCQNGISPYWPPVNVWKCSSCGILFRNPAPLEQDLARLYREGWTDPENRTSITGGTGCDLAQIYAGKLAGSLSLSDFKGSKIMDFGAGRGAMATALRSLGADVYVVDLFGSQYLREQGFKAFQSLEELPAIPFDGIVCIDVIEHLKTPRVEIQKFRELLAPAGWLYLATPNARGLKARLTGARWRQAVTPVHTVFFTSESLSLILRRCDYSRWRKLKWFVKYAANPARGYLQRVLQLLSMDGELRFLAFK